jgi:hypothetical protein
MLYYNPVMLARRLSALDVPSSGRLRVGMDLGWSKDEFDAAGASWCERGARAAEGEMPEQGMAREVVPGGAAGHRRIHHHWGWVSRDHVPSGWNTERAEPSADAMGGP